MHHTLYIIRILITTCSLRNHSDACKLAFIPVTLCIRYGDELTTSRWCPNRCRRPFPRCPPGRLVPGAGEWSEGRDTTPSNSSPFPQDRPHPLSLARRFFSTATIFWTVRCSDDGDDLFRISEQRLLMVTNLFTATNLIHGDMTVATYVSRVGPGHEAD